MTVDKDDDDVMIVNDNDDDVEQFESIPRMQIHHLESEEKCIHEVDCSIRGKSNFYYR